MFGNGKYRRLIKEYRERYAKGVKVTRVYDHPFAFYFSYGISLFITVIFGIILSAGKETAAGIGFFAFAAAIAVYTAACRHNYKKKSLLTDKMINAGGSVRYDCEITESGYEYWNIRGGGRKMAFKISYIKNGEKITDILAVKMQGWFYGVDMNKTIIMLYETRTGEKLFCVRLNGMDEYRQICE